MTQYILRRILQTLGMIIVLSYVCFGLMSLMPGDPVDIMITSNPKITSADIDRLKSLYGLDQPVYKRYLSWMGQAIQGDLGYSRQYRIPVTEIIGPNLVNTFWLAISALTLSILIAIPLGVISALKQGTKVDYIINFISFAGISIPSFWLAIVLILIFAVAIPILPAGGTQTITTEDMGFFAMIKDRAYYLVLPVLSLALQQIGRFARFSRSSMLEALRNDFVRTAKAKGLTRQTVIWKHAFRNALIPLITILALSFSSVFSGAILTETVFAYQGVGKLVFDAINASDFNVAMVSFMISITMVLLANLLADLLYGVADPRITYK